MRHTVAVLAAVLLPPALAACQPSVVSSPRFGDSVQHNIAMQVVNPDPHPGDEPPPEASGRRIADAIERYQSGKVIKPVPMNTSTVTVNGTAPQ